MRRPRLDLVRVRRQARVRLRETLLQLARSDDPRVAGAFRQSRLAARAVGSRVTGRQLGWVWGALLLLLVLPELRLGWRRWLEARHETTLGRAARREAAR